MLIFQEWDDGSTVYLGRGGARAFKRAVRKFGRKDNLITGYNRDLVLKRTGAIFVLQYWVNELDKNGYFGRVKKSELVVSIRAIKRG